MEKEQIFYDLYPLVFEALGTKINLEIVVIINIMNK